ncbi:hypothetical protein SRHO_G00026860 [Serrasalmus rhombeus]
MDLSVEYWSITDHRVACDCIDRTVHLIYKEDHCYMSVDEEGYSLFYHGTTFQEQLLNENRKMGFSRAATGRNSEAAQQDRVFAVMFSVPLRLSLNHCRKKHYPSSTYLTSL